MKLENLRIETEGKLTKAVATIVWEDSDRPDKDIYFATTEEFSQSIHCDPHAFLVASIMPAVRFKEKRIKIDARICPELTEGLETALLQEVVEKRPLLPLHPLLSSYSKDFIDERDLSHDISSVGIFDRALANHVHRLIPFNRTPGRVE